MVTQWIFSGNPDFISSDIPKTGCLKGEKDDSGEMFNVKLNVQQGFHPRHVSFPQNAITPQTGNTSLSQSAGVVWGTGTVPSVFLAELRISC